MNPLNDPLRSHLPNATWFATAPGRVNLLGEHVDYNDGPVLPAAIDRAVRIAAAPRKDRLAHITALDLNETAAFDLEHLPEKVDVNGKPLPGWALYPAGIAWALQSRGLPVSGLDAVFTSDVPMSAGLSSSAAVELAFSVIWQALGGWQESPMSLAHISQQAENAYVGVKCGLMDQFASAHGVEGCALYLDTRSLLWHAIPLPPHTAIVIADSGIRRNLTASAYNERRSACETAVSLLQTQIPGIRALRDITPSQFAAHAGILPSPVRERARHVVEECSRVDRAVALLQAGDARGFGQLMFEGHASLRDLYQVSIPELDALVEIAREVPGCWGARLTGAGFGGCTVNLVEDQAAETFMNTLKTHYEKTAGRQAQIYLCHASRGAHLETYL
ncbi:MAG: galactokinase [Anaerolineaceae bacterium]